jgi:hypothetical protein
MTTTWLDGFDQIRGNDSGTFVKDAPLRIVQHTTEGSSIDGAVGAYRKNNTWPHFTVDAVKRRKVQHVPLTKPGRAMANLAGGVETNRQGAIQIELVGFAAKTQDMTDEELRWLAVEVYAPILAATGISTRHPRFVGTEAGTIATVKAKQRMSAADWLAFDGICGHQHVPENHHWDPGRFPIDRLLSFLPSGPPSPDPGDDEMYVPFYLLKIRGKAQVWQIPLPGGKPIPLSQSGLATARNLLAALGVPKNWNGANDSNDPDEKDSPYVKVEDPGSDWDRTLSDLIKTFK